MRATPFKHDELESLAKGYKTADTDQYIACMLAQEVLYQRRWMAYTARVIEAQTLDLKSLAKCRRKSLSWMVDALRSLVRGEHVVSERRGLESEYHRLTAAVGAYEETQ